MSTHYLVDLFFSASVDAARIMDVRDPANLESVMNGAFVVRVPDGVRVTNPADYLDLVTQKYAGLQGFYAGFTQIATEDFSDATGVDAVNSSKIFLGQRGSVALLPSGVCQSVVVPLAYAPTQVIVVWEVYQTTATDDKNGRYVRTYVEVPTDSSGVTCSVSFNSGGTFTSASDGTTLNVGIPDQGTDLVVRLTNGSSDKVHLASWAVIY